MPRKDLTGQEINSLIFISYSHTNQHRASHWNIKCFCGKIFTCNASNIKNGHTRSCGCIRHIHNSTGTPEYTIWKAMKARCYNINNDDYPRYGERGIVVCDRWNHSFNNFIEDMGLRPSNKYSIERKDTDGNYCPENCLWATAKEQQRNKSSNKILTLNGESKTMIEWSETLNISYWMIAKRIQKGWSDEKALLTPPMRTNKPKLTINTTELED